MGAWIKGGLAALVASAACWGGAIAWWQASGKSPSNGELLAFLVAVPLALVAAVVAGRRLLAARAEAIAGPQALQS